LSVKQCAAQIIPLWRIKHEHSESCPRIFPAAAERFPSGWSIQAFFINIVLTLLGLVPGIAHAIWLVVTNKKGRADSLLSE